MIRLRVNSKDINLRIDVPSCNFGIAPSKEPDIAACHGPSLMRDPARNRLVFSIIS